MTININAPAMPNINDTTDLYGFMTYVNNGAGGIFFPLMLLAIWVVIFISSLESSRLGSASRAWTFASFFSAIVGIILAILDLLNKKYIYALVLMFAFGIVWIILQNSRE